jgi:cyclic peptide transporter
MLMLLCFPILAEIEQSGKNFKEFELKVQELMDDGDIPGLVLVLVNEDGSLFIKGYGYSDEERKKPVDEDTLFELASCSKAFTALAALKLEKDGKIDFDLPVSHYLPWFKAHYQGEEVDITLRQFLHQTSGVSWSSVENIYKGSGSDALERSIKALSGVNLANRPGTKFEYATINYDVVGLVVEKVSGVSFEEYIKKDILIPLGLKDTLVGGEIENPQKAVGYKIGFFDALPYDAPAYGGNDPAGYVVSNGRDMARWLKWHLGLISDSEVADEFFPLIKESHKRNFNVAPDGVNFSSYGMGWQAYVDGKDLVDHGGMNPNFTSFVGFKPKQKTGCVVLGNSNSTNTVTIGYLTLKYLEGKPLELPPIPGNTLDKAASLISLMLAFYLLCVLAFIVFVPVEVAKGRRGFGGFGLPKLGKLALALIVLVPFILAVYLVPYAMSNVSWDTAVVWSPISFQVAGVLVLAAIGLSYIGFLLSSLFPQKNKYVRSIPMVIVLSLLSGGANAMVIFLISSSLFSNIALKFQLYYFALAFLVYILGRKVLQTRLVQITFDIVYDMRMRLIEKVFLTSYQRFERLDRGRVYATINDDTGQISNSANIVVQLVTSIITTVGAFLYLATIAFWATAVTILVVGAIAILYGIVSQKAEQYFEEARDTRNVFMGLLNGMLDGFKELSLQVNKKKEYRKDLDASCDEFRVKIVKAVVKFINAFLIGESLLVIVLGAVGFAIPRIFPDISTFTLMSFIMILLYLIGPINGILNSVPQIIQMRVSWNRVKSFEDDIPANMDPGVLNAGQERPGAVDLIKAEGVVYEYEREDSDEEGFKVGPIDFEAKKGEITFIIGGNGSGKTTLAKLLTGLYHPHEGQVSVDGPPIADGRIGEYFSTVFANYHLFQKMYNVDMDGNREKAAKNLQMLSLADKVGIKDNEFSTIDLSGGQRKRLALLQCYLEDAPIYLFDEIAADQDPEFRKFFYRDLLIRMKNEWKIVIAITHDDHYFDVADKIIKMDMGKIEKVDANYRTTSN